MAKVIYCSKVNPSSDCDHVIRGDSEEEVLRQAAVHAKEHGLQPTPELMAAVRAAIDDEQATNGDGLPGSQLEALPQGDDPSFTARLSGPS